MIAGDVLVPGDILCEIQTDKAVVGMEYEDEGILAKILVSQSRIPLTEGFKHFTASGTRPFRKLIEISV